ncbi:MAG: Omp28-related outer membrane protein [Bacteroidetes bacterium]|nr:Omp28-related outer membrane protein [Bacteroidota bacterium]
MKKISTFFITLLISFSLNIDNAKSQNNVLLEFCTGTWCQWCPCGHDIIHDILLNYPNTVVLAYHGAGSDPWQSYSQGIRSIFGFSAYPTGCVGRRSGVIDRSAWNNEVVIQSLLVQPGVNISVSGKSYDANTRTLNATVNVTANEDLTGDFKINYVLTENNLIYSQTGNSSCTGGSNYEHDDVVKSMLNGDQGELLSSGTWTSGQTITRNISYVIPGDPQVSVTDNCDINIFVYKQGASISQSSYVQNAMKTSLTGTTGISSQNITPSEYKLTQNYPNPFNPSTNFSFSIPKTEKVSLKIYDILGNVVDTYVDGVLNAGTYSVQFDGTNLSSGVYFYTINAGSFSETKRMLLTK